MCYLPRYGMVKKKRDLPCPKINYLIVVYFVFCLLPLGFGELSVNYAFVLLPIALILQGGTVKKVSIYVLVLSLVCILIFFLSIFLQLDYFGDYGWRRLASFILFFSFLTYSLIDIDDQMIVSFKAAIIVAALAFSIISIVTMLNLQSSGPVHFEVKRIIGTQRYGFIYIFAVFILFHYRKQEQSVLLSGVYLIFMFLLLIGLLLTFSRSSIVALVILVLLYMLHSIYDAIGRYDSTIILAMLKYISVVLISYNLLFYLYPMPIEFFKVSLVTPLLDLTLFESMEYQGSSEGIRLVRMMDVFGFILDNPLTGSGFLGIWSVSDGLYGSAHSQYIDTLLRLGLVGFSVYLFILAKLLVFLRGIDHSFYYGFIGILVYGLFHETFKESQGAFILSFLLGVYSQYYRKLSYGIRGS